jgi:hypothetical protein
VKVVDSQGNFGTQNYTLTVYPSITATPTTLPAGAMGTPYSQMLTPSGGAGGPYLFSVASGTALSAVGLTLSPAGLISGTPNATEAAAPLTIQVADSLGNFTHLNYTLTITAPAPIASLSSATLTFAAQPSGTASAVQTVTLSNTGNAALSITGTGISIAGANAPDFSQTNACGTSVTAGSNCLISVTFTPSLSAGSETATLNVADNASGTPQQVQLSGIALPPPSVSCTNPAINFSGDSATATFTCTGTGLTQTLDIALVCNLPSAFSNYTCSFNPNSLDFMSTTTPPYTASTTLTIQPANGASLERRPHPWAVSTGGVALGTVLWLPACMFAMRRKKGKSKQGMLWLLILVCGLPMISSCGGKSGPATPPAGTYQGSMVLTGPGLNETITFTIQVK